jgi:hypothetical protein
MQLFGQSSRSPTVRLLFAYCSLAGSNEAVMVDVQAVTPTLHPFEVPPLR